MSGTVRPNTWTGWRPRDGARTLAGVAAITAGAAAWSGGVAPAVLAVPLILAGGGVLLDVMRRQAAAEAAAARLCAADGESGGRQTMTAMLERLAERFQAIEHRTANIHPVTGLPTREHLYAQINGDIAVNRGAQLLGAVRFADFDRLAAFDHAAANAALKQFAARLLTATRTSHVIGQIDRDCFGLWFRSEGDLDSAAAEFRAIVYVLSQEMRDGEAVLTPTVEAGAVSWPRDGADAGHLLLRVTAALTRPQMSAAGELTLADPCSIQAAREQFTLEQDLAQAIAEDQLAMVFQPVVDLSEGRMIGAEALLRWEHPKLGLVSPAHFFPIVEATGLSERFGLWVLNAACREARGWSDEGLGDLKVAVNLSARQLMDPDLRTKIERTLERHGLHPKALELELTETAAMADAGRTLHLFAQLRALGISLAIDDFGSGYSSLSYLKNLPFDKLKIDREFVTGVDTRRDSQAICKALIELGRGLDLLVLAEGVETASELATLRGLGCHVFQGYYFSRPCSGEDFRALARDPAFLARLAPSHSTQFTRFQGRLSA